MAYFEFPHTRTYDSDLGWLIRQVKDNIDSIDNINNWIQNREPDPEVIDFSKVYNTIYEYEGIDDSGNTDVSAALESVNDNLGLRSGRYRISNDCTLTINLAMPEGAQFIVDSGVTLTLEGYIEAGRYQIFTGAGNVQIRGNNTIFPEWFGAVNDGSTDCYEAFTKCFNSFYRGYVSLKGGSTSQAASGVWQPSGTCYFTSQPIMFNKGYSRLGCDSGYAVISTTGNNALIIGSGGTSTSSQLEHMQVDHICVCICNAIEKTADAPNNYAVQFIGTQSSYFHRIRVIGSPCSYYFSNNTGSSWEYVKTTPATTAILTGDVNNFWIDCSHRNYSCRFTNCSVSYGGTSGKSTAFCITGNHLTDLFFQLCEVNHVTDAIDITTVNGQSFANIKFTDCIFDQVARCFIDLNDNNSMGDIIFNGGYFERQANATVPAFYFHSDLSTARNGKIILSDCMIWDDTHAAYSVGQETVGSMVIMTNVYFKNCGNCCDFKAGNFRLQNCMMHNTSSGAFESFVKAEGGSNGNVTGCYFNNQAGNSTMETILKLLDTSNTDVITNTFSGFYSAILNTTDHSSVIINRQTSVENKIPGFTHS